MFKIILPSEGDISLLRRRFVTGLATGGALMGLGLGAKTAEAAVIHSRSGPGVMRGSRFDLTYSPTPVNFAGSARYATAINGSVPAPALRFLEGDTVTLRVTR